MTARRIDGLDLVRACAILFVLFGHMAEHSKPPAWLHDPFYRWGSLGVELFFTLSGFLIGGIVVRMVLDKRFNGPRDLLHFWLRRWLRTLPAYYVFLLVFLRFDWRGPFTPLDFPGYFFFVQNLFSPTPAFYELSWSLAIEEWFYLLFPLLLLGALAVFRHNLRALTATVLAFLVVPLVLKLLWVLPIHGQDIYTAIRVPVAYRLDSLMFGVAMALVRAAAPAMWRLLLRLFPLALLGFVAIMWVFYDHLRLLGGNRTAFALLFPVISLCSAALLPRLSVLSLAALPRFRAFCNWLSRVSYSLYLSHILVFIWVNNYLFGHGLRAAVYDRWYLLYPIYLVLVAALATASYLLIEQPVLRLRDRWQITRDQPPSPPPQTWRPRISTT